MSALIVEEFCEEDLRLQEYMRELLGLEDNCEKYDSKRVSWREARQPSCK